MVRRLSLNVVRGGRLYVGLLAVLLVAGAAGYRLTGGSGSSRDTARLLRCYDNTAANEVKFNTGVYECLSPAAVSLATDKGYAHATAVVDEVFKRMSMSAGSYCAQINQDITLAAMANGEDYRDLVNDHSSLCTFAIVHAIGIFAVDKVYPGNATTSVTEFCSLTDLTILNPDTFRSQCWHGAGYGLQGASKGDVGLTTDLCESAPDSGSVANCYEGIYERIRHDKWTQPWEREPWESILQSCSSKSFNLLRGVACYKDLTISLTVDNMYYREVRTIVPEYLKVCAAENDEGIDGVASEENLGDDWSATENSSSRQRACVVGYGYYVGLIAAAEGNPGSYGYKDALRACSLLDRYVRACYMRATMTITKTELRPQGVPLEDILAATPVDLRAGLKSAYLDYMSRQSGRSINEKST